MAKRSTMFCAALVQIVVLGAFGLEPAHPASMQVYPGSQRSDRAVYLLEGEVNPIFFMFLAGDNALMELPKLSPDAPDDIVLSFDLPKTIHYFGTVDFRGNGVYAAEQTQDVVHDGAPYVRHRVALDKKVLAERLVQYDYSVKVWVRPPRLFDGMLYWRLLRGQETLAESSNPIRTLGPIRPDAILPKDFILYLWYWDSNMPDELMDERIALYRRLGITHFGCSYGVPGPLNAKGMTSRRRAESAMIRRAGIKVVAERGGSFSLEKTLASQGNQDKGLASRTADCAKSILNDQEKSYFSNVADLADAFMWDYEPAGPERYRAFDDLKTIAAFAKAKGITENLTPRLVRETYGKEYYACCQDLLADPVRAWAQMVHAVKPGLPLLLCQGSGCPIGDNVDPKRYDAVVDYHLPMIYTDPFTFQARVRDTAEYLGGGKLVPVTCCGYSVGLWRPLVGSTMLDYLSTASCGTVGLAHWPGVDYMGAEALYDLYQGARALAPVEDFYRKGKPAGDISAMGLPYLEKKVTVGRQTLDLSQPYWKNHLVVKPHAFGGERLVTLLNYHTEETAFVRIVCDGLKETAYLVNPADGACLTIADKVALPPTALREGVLVKVKALGAGLWLLTQDPEKVKGLRPVGMDELQREYDSRRKAFAEGKGASVELGKKGGLEVAYDIVKDGDNEDVCLRVSSPVQTVCFTDIGGKMWKWEVGGLDVVKRKGHTQNGVGMDLLWVPPSARWSGDQVRPMALRRCANDGNQVVLEFAGEFKTAIPGLMIDKTFTIPADLAAVNVNVRLKNDTPMPVTASYWSHNCFESPGGNERSFVILQDGKVFSPPYNEPGLSTRIFLNPDIAKDWKQFIFSANPKVFGTGGPVFGEYFVKARMGVLLRLPSDFFQIYRWESPNDAGLEWMHRPIPLQSGQSADMDFRIELCPNVNFDTFKQVVTKP